MVSLLPLVPEELGYVPRVPLWSAQGCRERLTEAFLGVRRETVPSHPTTFER